MTEDEYATCHRIIGALAWQMAGSVTPFLQEDLELEAWCGVMKGLHRWNADRVAFGTYIYGVVRRTLVDYYRKHNHWRAGRAAPMPVTKQVDWIDRAPTATERIADQVRMVPSVCQPPFEYLDLYLSFLEPREQHIIRSNVLGDVPLKVLALEYGLTEARISQLKHKALQKLAVVLDG